MIKHKRRTVADMLALKGKQQLVQVWCGTPEEAEAADRAGIDIISTNERLFTPEFRAAAPNAFIVPGLAYGVHCSAKEYLRAGFACLRMGSDAVYSAASVAIIKRMAEEGIPVVGHVGLVPSRATWTGGYRAVGKTAASAMQVYEYAKQLEDAGVFAIEVEVVPERVATEISKRLKILCMSMGSGSGCDTQYLFATDVLGTNTTHVPRHAKRYADLASELRRLQDMRVAAFSEYVRDVKSGAFPAPQHLVGVAEPEFKAFMKQVKQKDK